LDGRRIWPTDVHHDKGRGLELFAGGYPASIDFVERHADIF
jgi:hypothetical protein